MKTTEHLRVEDKGDSPIPQWQKWGPYVSERQWGTVREDYSSNGDAWNFFPFEDAHRRVYRWGEDGIAGWCDRYQNLVFAPVFWNGKDPILKERLFGLSSHQGNHAEDVKECYYHLDGIPSHAYMKYLYKYPQREFPYELLKKKNAERSTMEGEYELIDTDIFADNAYFDIFIEYAKVDSDDFVVKIEAINRGNSAAPLHLLPHLWFRNQWSWWDVPQTPPKITNISKDQNCLCLLADAQNIVPSSKIPFDYHIGKRYLYATAGGIPLFTNNENHAPDRIYCKDGFHNALIHKAESINPKEEGTKACIHYVFNAVAPGASVNVYLRLTPQLCEKALDDVEALIAKRKKEADMFYAELHPKGASEELKTIQRQACAGMLWNKQFYYFDINQWLKGDNTKLLPPSNRSFIRNGHWHHLNSMRILSMPDKWEYSWFAAWDLAFQALTFALIDIEFAKEQIWLLLFDQFQHPNGAIPAYEWEFSDLNPPIQAWAAYQLYLMQKEKEGVKDYSFLKKCFHKLIMNFAYWVNQVDSSGCNVFEGGFLGLDNITLVDRSKEDINGAILKQSDGTGWMAMFSLNLMRIALELANEDPTYEGLATKFFQHFVYIAHAMHKRDEKSFELWHEEDGFFYDVLVYPDGNFSTFRVRSLVGLTPLFAIEILSEEELDKYPTFKRDFLWFIKNKMLYTNECVIPVEKNGKQHYVLTLHTEAKLKSVLQYLWDPEEFCSPYGIRSLSKYHEKHPFHYKQDYVSYEPGESITRMKGGNSNWRGPIWMPMNYLIIYSLKKYASIFDVEVSVKGEKAVSLNEILGSFVDRLIALFTKDGAQKRPFLGDSFPFHNDPNFKDLILFYEYFHAETGRGLGASHQAGWSALIANLLDEFKDEKRNEQKKSNL